MKQKENGRIHHLGFSVHGSYTVLERFLEAYGEGMEFGQLQLNYLDWKFQNAKAKVELLQQYHIPVWVMEPLRGGSLVALSEESESKLNSLRPEERIPAWAFRYLQTIPNVTVVLSGMSNYEQMVENIKTYEEDKPLNTAEMNALQQVAEEMLGKNILPCTACRYCTSHCPMDLNIPELLSLYNEHSFTGGGFIAPMALRALPEEKKPSACIGCQSCEQVCPQQIEIAKAMKEFAKKMSL
jgi:predicted aldo/keto reductase-like oxidoreductase